MVLGGFSGFWLRIYIQNSEIQYSRSNMADHNVEITLKWNENEYSRIFEVSDYESSLEIRKFNMVNLKWRTKM